MKKAVFIVAFIFILLSISQVSAVLVYNSARSNVTDKTRPEVGDEVILLLNDFSAGVEFFKEVRKGEPIEAARLMEQEGIFYYWTLLGGWDEVEDVPCDLRGELNLAECETVAVAGSR